MPGIYVQDGGETSSALGNILGNIAQQVGPEGAAKAALLQQQTQGADLANERTWTQQVLDAAAARRANGIMATGGADAQPPGAPGSVASTVTRLSEAPINVGPGGRLPLVDPSNMSPNDTYMAGRLFSGISPGDLTTAINLGRQEKLGAGQDYTTQGDIYKAQHAPHTVTTGDTYYVDPMNPSAPVLHGASSADQAAASKAIDDTTTEAHAAFSRGAQAITDSAELDDIVKGYDQLINIPDGDWKTPATLELLKAATAAGGGRVDFTRFSSKQEAIDDLTKRMQLMWGAGRALGGDPTLRGYADNMNKALDVAKNSSSSFHRMADVQKRQLQNLQDEGAASKTFLDAANSGGATAAAPVLRDTLIANRQRRADELRKQGFSASDQPETPKSPTPTPEPPEPPKKTLDSNGRIRAQNMIKQYGRDYVLKYLADEGYDTSGL
jgi:hypothetical protein